MKPKLTKPQETLFQEVLEKGKVQCNGSYKPAMKLIELGLVQHKELSFGMVLLSVSSTANN